MRIVAYSYSDPLLEIPPDRTIWGWEVDAVYADVGDRPALAELLVVARSPRSNQEIDYVLVRRYGELGDSVEMAIACLETFSELGIAVIALQAPTQWPYPAIPGSESGSTAMATSTTVIPAVIPAVIQDIQRDHQGQILRQGHARNRIAAVPPPGRAPYGYRRGRDRYALDRAAAAVVKDFFEHFLLYGSLRSAVRHLERKHGKRISVATGRRWLTHPVYRGDLAYTTGQVIPNTHLAILSRAEAAQIDRLLRRNRSLPARTASAPRSLAGLVGCDRCQSPLTVVSVARRGRSADYLYLRPTACQRSPGNTGNNTSCPSARYEVVLNAAIARICSDLPAAVAARTAPDAAPRAPLEAAIAQKQAILTQLPDLERKGILDPTTTQLRAFHLRADLARLQDQLNQLPPPNLAAIAQTVSIPQFWHDLSETERRFYLREFLRHIWLLPPEQPGDRTWSIQRLEFVF